MMELMEFIEGIGNISTSIKEVMLIVEQCCGSVSLIKWYLFNVIFSLNENI